MGYLNQLQAWMERTAFYNNFLARMPAPLDNIYFDTVLLAVILLYCGYRVIDGFQMSKRHRAVKARQLELQEKTAENEIHMINHEREARNNREEMNQFMRFMEMSVMSNTTKQMGGFDQFKEQERREKIAENNEKVHEKFDTIDADDGYAVVSPQDVIDVRPESDAVTAMKIELETLRAEMLQMQQESGEKERSRDADMERVKAAMMQREEDKQKEIEKLQAALSTEKENAKKQIDQMLKNLNVYKADKEKEIADLTSKITSDLSDDEKQAEIDRLRAEMDQMEKEKASAIAEREKEFQKLTDEKQAQIDHLTEEMKQIKDHNSEGMTEINRAYEEAQSQQRDMEAKKQDQIRQLEEKLDSMKQDKEDEIARIQKEYEKTIASLRAAVSDANQRAEASDAANLEQSEQIAKMQNMLAMKETDDALNEQLAQMRKDRDATLSEKEAAEKEVEKLHEQIAQAQEHEEKQISIAKEQIEQMQSAKDAPANAARLPETVKKAFDNQGVEEDKDSNFRKTMRQHEQELNRSQQIETEKMMQEEKAYSNKTQLEQTLIVDAKEEKVKEQHNEDEAVMAAIEERKRKALEAEMAENKPKKRKGILPIFGK